MSQPEWLAVQVVGQVEGLGPLARIGGEPRAQVGQGFPGTERGDGRDPPVRRSQGAVPPGRDHDPAVGSGWPETIEVGRVGQVIEDHQPPALGSGQPGQETLCGREQVVARIGGAQFRERQRVAGQDGVPVAGLDPGQQVHRAAVPELMRQRRRQLGLSRSAGGGQISRAAGGGQISRAAGGGRISGAAGGAGQPGRPRRNRPARGWTRRGPGRELTCHRDRACRSGPAPSPDARCGSQPEVGPGRIAAATPLGGPARWPCESWGPRCSCVAVHRLLPPTSGHLLRSVAVDRNSCTRQPMTAQPGMGSVL